jgi:NADPH-dependent F420 reductase
VVIGSRDAVRAGEAVGKLRVALPAAVFEGFDNEVAATKARIVFVTVPFRSQSETYASLVSHLREEQIVVDCTVPLAAAVSGKATRVLGVWQGSAAQQAQEMVPKGARVVAALHTVAAALLGDLAHPLQEDTLVCGDRKADKRAVAEVLTRIEGLRPWTRGAWSKRESRSR